MSLSRLMTDRSNRIQLTKKQDPSLERALLQKQDNTFVQFIKEIDVTNAAALNQSIRSGQKLHVQFSHNRKQPQIKPRTQNMPQIQRVLLNKVETGINKLGIQDQKKVQDLLTSIEQGAKGQHLHEELVKIITSKKLIIRILENYGNKQYVGLTSIELYDIDGKVIQPQSISFENDNTIENLINGQHFTIQENQMWKTSHKLPLSIIVGYDGEVHTMKIWNYNKNRKELDIGAKKVDITVNDQIVFFGVIEKGCANTYTDYGQVIQLTTQKLKTESNQAPFYQSMQSLNSKKSEDNREVNSSKNSSQQKYQKPKIIANPFDEDIKIKNLNLNFFNNEPSSNRIKPQIRLVKNQQLFKSDEDNNQFQKRGVAQIAAGFQTNRNKRITIPECPQGSKLTFKILKNWGDLQYVGLTGLELFDSEGDLIYPHKIQGFFKESSKLFNGVNITQDHNHMCLEKINKNMEIKIEFKECKISMIRIWNYNRARIHCQKGAKILDLQLDGEIIFQGEIKQAKGTCGPENAEYIMFTQDQKLLKKLEEKDWLNALHESQLQQEKFVLENAVKLVRPDTSSLYRQIQPSLSGRNLVQKQALQHQKHDSISTKPQSHELMKAEQRSLTTQHIQVKPQAQVSIKVLKIVILKNWGDRFCVGIDKLYLHNQNGQPLLINQYKLICSSYESLFKCDQRWLCPIGSVELIFNFQEPTIISRIQITNYNKSDELEKGAQLIKIYGDNKPLCSPQGVFIRKGLGVTQSPQLIELPNFSQIKPVMSNLSFNFKDLNQNLFYQTICLPQGMKLSFHLYQTWGDPFYIGLNGVEIFNVNGEIIQPMIYANPQSIRELEQMQMDCRTPDKLLNGQNITLETKNMWLAPFINTDIERLQQDINCFNNEKSFKLNQIFFLFEQPEQISAISIYNYSKTPTRGVKEIEIQIDDYIIYRVFIYKKQFIQGYLNMSTLTQQRNVISGNNKTTILFTEDDDIIENVQSIQIRDSILGQQLVMINENQQIVQNTIRNKLIKQQSITQRNYKDLQRPTTGVYNIVEL